MHPPNHRRPAPEPVATVSPTVVPLEQRPMPVTDCPRLRRMRELLAEEEAANFRDDRAQRQATAIDRWRAALPCGRQSRVLPAWTRSARRRHVARRDRFDPPTESWVCSPSVSATRSDQERHRDAWRIVAPTGGPTIDDRVGSSVTAKCLSLSSAAIINRTASQERTIWTPARQAIRSEGSLLLAAARLCCWPGLEPIRLLWSVDPPERSTIRFPFLDFTVP